MLSFLEWILRGNRLRKNYNEDMRLMRMEWVERLNQAINYMEENIRGKIDYEQAAKLAGCSGYVL